MSTFPEDVLRAQRSLWRLPEVYPEVVAAGAAPYQVAAHTVASAVLRELASPMRVVSALGQLLEDEEFEAAERLLADTAKRKDASSGAITKLRQNLSLKITETSSAIEFEIRHLQARNARLPRPLESVARHTAIAEELGRRRGQHARAALGEASAAITTAEGEEAAALERSRLARFGSFPQGRDLDRSTRVADALRRKFYDVARALLNSSSPETDAHLKVLPFRAPLPRYPASEVLSWFDGPGPRRPPHFDQRWGIAEGDALGTKIIEATRAFLQVDTTPDTHDFQRLAYALSAALEGRTDLAPPQVFAHGTTWWCRLGGSWHCAIPGLAGTEYGNGVLLCVMTNHAASSAIEVRDPQIGDAYYLRIGELPTEWNPEREIALSWHEVLETAGDPARSAQLVRCLARRVDPRDMFALGRRLPIGGASSRGDSVAAVFSDGGSVLWVAPSNSGRSAFLDSAAYEAEQRGWLVRRLETPVDLDQLIDEVAGFTSLGEGAEAWVRQQGVPGVFLAADDVDQWEDQFAARLLGLLELLHAGSPESIAAACTARPSIREQLHLASWQVLPPLTIAASARWVRRLMDLAGAQYVDAHVVDRIALYSGGHPSIGRLLLHHLAIAHGPRRRNTEWHVDIHAVDQVFMDEGFVAAAQLLLLDGVESDALLLGCLAAVLHRWKRASRGPCGTADVIDELTSEGASLAATDPNLVAAALSRLECAYLLRHDSRGWALPVGGIGRLLCTMDSQMLLAQAEAAAQ